MHNPPDCIGYCLECEYGKPEQEIKMIRSQHEMWAHEYNLLRDKITSLQTAVYEHQRYMWCRLETNKDGHAIDKGNHLVPAQWIAGNDSGSLADALAQSGWPTDQYGNLFPPKRN